MDKRHMLGIVAALSFAGGVACVQAQNSPPPDQKMPPPSSSSSPSTTGSSDPGAASSPHQRDATGTVNSPENQTPATQGSTNPDAASSPHQRESTRTAEAAGMGVDNAGAAQLVGLEVISPAGNSLGTVIDAVVDPSGAPAYIVISAPKGNTPMPYSTAASMIHDNAVVVDPSKLNDAPKVQQGAWKDKSSKSWRTESDRYWQKSSMDSDRKAMKSSKKERS